MSPRFPITLGLPAARSALLEAAAAAVHAEYVESVRWKKLCAFSVKKIDAGASLDIVVIDVGHTVSFDWTWEGALARGFLREDDALEELSQEQVQARLASGAESWHGPIVEVDVARGLLYVDVSESPHAPAIGVFWVRPFEFLADLDRIFSDDACRALQKILPARLRAAQGSVHPSAAASSATLPELAGAWRHSWADLWGPPGTGKTTTVGRQVAHAVRHSDERILVVSTTNAATDEAAVAIGRTVQSASELQQMTRVGRGTMLKRFREEHVEAMLEGTEVRILEQIGVLAQKLRASRDSAQRAALNAQINKLRLSLRGVVSMMFADAEKRVVVTTAFAAVRALGDPQVAQSIADGFAPFTTIVIDEASLLSKATVAVLSLLGARRVVLVGDPLQLSPIARISRVLPTAQQEWMGSSALSHLHDPVTLPAGVHLLEEQHRMHPDIGDVVSRFQYGGRLRSAATVLQRADPRPAALQDVPRAVWYCLDEDRRDHHSLRAQRGPGGRSFVREYTEALLRRMFQLPGMAKTNGLFITPFTAQARVAADLFAQFNITGWQAGTVHSSQGVTVDMVIFDTVHAGSTAWSYAEWKRIINVALSRARHFAMLIASRDEMQQYFLAPLRKDLPAVSLKGDHKTGRLAMLSGSDPVVIEDAAAHELAADRGSALLGRQIRARKLLRPLVSQQQQQLVRLSMDGGPRLVRGVAGSGKTFVLARWLIQSALRLREQPQTKIWVVYANAALERLLLENIDQSESQMGRPAVELAHERTQAIHIDELLRGMEQELAIAAPNDTKAKFDYDERAKNILAAAPAGGFAPRCAALFIDEAQDMGANTLKLLISLVQPDRPDAPKLRPAHIFLDNAQNIYDRSTPNWSELGLDMRGRSTAMKESFRSTNPITEFALNAYLHLKDSGRNGPQSLADPDHRELFERDLIEPVRTADGTWWRVRFNDVDGPPPKIDTYADSVAHDRAVAEAIRRWVVEESVRPEDIVVLCNRKADGEAVAEAVREVAGETFACRFRSSRDMQRNSGEVLVTTLHSFKGYDAEVVVMVRAEHYVADGKTLDANFYVAVTRARSMVWIAAVDVAKGPGRRLLDVMQKCLKITDGRGALPGDGGSLDERLEIVDRVPVAQRDWFTRQLRSHPFAPAPVRDGDGALVAEPLVQLQTVSSRYAVFTTMPDASVVQQLESLGIRVVTPGAVIS